MIYDSYDRLGPIHMLALTVMTTVYIRKTILAVCRRRHTDAARKKTWKNMVKDYQIMVLNSMASKGKTKLSRTL